MPIGATEGANKTTSEYDDALGVVDMDSDSNGEGGAATPPSDGLDKPSRPLTIEQRVKPKGTVQGAQ